MACPVTSAFCADGIVQVNPQQAIIVPKMP